MTIEDRLNDLITAKADMKSAIESKGVDVTGGLTTYANAIRSIESGDGGATLPVGTKFGYSTFEVAPFFDTSGYTDMSSMFRYCEQLKSVPLYDTHNVTTMLNMFYCCYLLTSCPVFDTSNVTDMRWMFYFTNIKHAPLLDTSKVTTMYNMFCQCWDLTYVSQYNTSNVTDMGGMLLNCSKLQSLPLLDAGNVKDIRYICGNCDELQHVAGFKDLGKQPDLQTEMMFSKCNKLTSDSVRNIINNLYDRVSAGYSVVEIQFPSNVFSLLSDADIAIATNKGWTITS